MVDDPKGTPMTSVALDGRVDLAEAAERLGWSEVRRFVYGSVYTLDGGARLYLFRFGAVVHEGVHALDPTILRVLEQAVGCRHLEQTSETYYLAAGPPGEGGPRIGWDRVLVPDQSPEMLAAVALLLGQSAALERYELAADRMAEETLEITRELRERGRIPRHTRELVRRVGGLISDRLEVARYFYLRDRPEATWENASIAEVYDKLFKNLELGERGQAMFEKLESVQGSLEIVLDLWQVRRSHSLEWGIIFLIVFEILLSLAKSV